jgi:hypothetical protein
MCRKVLEGICATHGVKARGLVSQLKELQTRGVIDGRLYEWADGLRIAGNEAVHDVNVTVSAEDSRDALEFTEALINYVITLHDKFEAYKARKTEPAVNAAAT